DIMPIYLTLCFWGLKSHQLNYGSCHSTPLDLNLDLCLLPMSEGACSEYVLLWYYHPPSRACRPFVYGGCEGNRNRFNTRQECQRRCGKERR
uniref:BPTI/Kunitz inhibitor domain-containing protein n=1 Tax=Esox lucius TaxID=8010 RepID=A0AAY5K920_ESOLU